MIICLLGPRLEIIDFYQVVNYEGHLRFSQFSPNIMAYILHERLIAYEAPIWTSSDYAGKAGILSSWCLSQPNYFLEGYFREFFRELKLLFMISRSSRANLTWGCPFYCQLKIWRLHAAEDKILE
jgi:hypothetical protein